MSYRKRTLRHMAHHTRDLARLINSLESYVRKLKATVGVMQDLETDSKALHHTTPNLPSESPDIRPDAPLE